MSSYYLLIISVNKWTLEHGVYSLSTCMYIQVLAYRWYQECWPKHNQFICMWQITMMTGILCRKFLVRKCNSIGTLVKYLPTTYRAPVEKLSSSLQVVQALERPPRTVHERHVWECVHRWAFGFSNRCTYHNVTVARISSCTVMALLGNDF